MPLTAKTLKNLKPGSHRDQPNLFLMVRADKDDPTKIRRTWVFRYYLNGTENQIGLGSFNKGVTLEAARKQAVRLRAQLNDGVDPAHLKRTEKAERKPAVSKARNIPTFAEMAQTFWDDQKSKWTNAKHRDQWPSSVKKYANPIIGKMPVNTIKREHLIQVMEQDVKKAGKKGKFWQVMWETCDRTRSKIEQVLDFATVRDLREGPNPAEWTGNLAFAFPAAGDAPVKQHASLEYNNLCDFMIELRERDAVAAKALEYLILTTARTDEVLGAKWTEMDFNTNIWTVPKERMKTRKTMKFDHRVPLSNEAVALLKSLPREEGNPYVFVGPISDNLSGMSMLMLLRRMNWKNKDGQLITSHGFRSTFKNWALELTEYEDNLSELALAHTIGDEAYRAYARTDQIEKRRRMMQDWANFCGRPFESGNVLPFPTKVAAE